VTADWIKSPTARQVLLHWADARPTWLWSQDGSQLIWRNDAARFFRGKLKKHGLKLAPEAVPIRGQVARLVRLGSVGRSSLSHIQFLLGDKPVSTTCACTPLRMPDGEIVLLIVAVDPIEPELLAAEPQRSFDSVTRQLLPPNVEFLLIDDAGHVAGGSPRGISLYAPLLESETTTSLPPDGEDVVSLGDEAVRVSRFQASPSGATLLLFEAAETDAPIESPVAPIAIDDREPPLPLGLPEAEQPAASEAASGDDAWVEALPASPDLRLSSLFDRLADDDGLYTPLTIADEAFTGPLPSPPEAVFVPPAEPEIETAAIAAWDDEGEAAEPAPMAAEPPLDAIGQLIVAAESESMEPAPEAPEPPRLWRVTGRGFRAEAQTAADAPDTVETPEPAPAEPSAPRDSEAVERVSRYNFDELSRILSDRVGRNPTEDRADAASAPKSGEGALINLTGETFILNRLPLGILVFRDQQVLFANRALTEMTGHDSIESVRSGGLSAVFPAETVSAGPVSQLVRRDGELVAVNARLQSITWHGKPALMLSASLAEPRIGHEAAVRSFAALAADTTEDGFVALDRSGVITDISLLGRVFLGNPDEDLIGRPIAALLDPSAIGELKLFLERPARFAETARPALRVGLRQRGLELSLFAEGQAGIVAGYFGLIRRRGTAAVPPSAVPRSGNEVEPTVLARMSRSIRRPLNSIVGFSEMIGGPDGARLPPERQAEYARDIRSAGQEITALIDEMDDYARLQEGRYPAQADDVELGALLETCLIRVRSHAGAGRVLVRNAVSEHLPRIIADRASLTQAVLNLLASAIEQTPAGGSVILSAQAEDDGSVVINLRDGGSTHRDFGERFMVFRDGPGRDGEMQSPVRSSVGLALTRSLLAVNALSLSVDPTSGSGTLFSLVIPADKVARGA
jgi:signal transduction histidine kinase